MLEGRLITGDAMFCQRDLSQEILDAKGHYLWFVKENQPTLLADIQGRVRPFRGRGFFPLGSSRSGVVRWTRRRPSTRDTAVGNVGRYAPPRR